MSDQQLADFRCFIEDCELNRRLAPLGFAASLSDLLRPALDEIDRLRAEVRSLRRELEIHA